MFKDRKPCECHDLVEICSRVRRELNRLRRLEVAVLALEDAIDDKEGHGGSPREASEEQYFSIVAECRAVREKKS